MNLTSKPKLVNSKWARFRIGYLTARLKGIAARQCLRPRTPPYDDDRSLVWQAGWDEQDLIYHVQLRSLVFEKCLEHLRDVGYNGRLIDSVLQGDYESAASTIPIQHLIDRWFPKFLFNEWPYIPVDNRIKLTTKRRYVKKWKPGRLLQK